MKWKRHKTTLIILIAIPLCVAAFCIAAILIAKAIVFLFSGPVYTDLVLIGIGAYGMIYWFLVRIEEQKNAYESVQKELEELIKSLRDD